jgi:hypothetical protein
MWSSAMANLVDKGLITMDDETEQWVRTNVDAPKKLGSRPTVDSTSKDSSPLDGKTPDGGTGTNGASPPNGASKGNNFGRTSGNVGKSPSSGAV